jgi:histidyl-tRNA synthetase
MSKTIQAIRGMNDILPEQIGYWQHLESVINDIVASYTYQEIRLPIVESTALFKRSVGEETDIVAKETYSFDDRNGDSLTLRPEGTAVCVRAGIQHGLFYNQIQRLWYMGPMFRHERPQKGRYRQFYQLGVEAFGMSGPDIDVELLAMTARLWAELGLTDQVELQINSLGTAESRMAYRAKLVEYFECHKDKLDTDSQRRLYSNPMRILDSKNSELYELISNAPKITQYLDAESKQHFDWIINQLENLGIAYKINPCLVRGLDYYSRTVFEWVTDKLGAQGTICAGGRYDGLVELLGGKPTPAVGFAVGFERVIALLEMQPLTVSDSIDIFLLNVGKQANQYALVLAEQVRDALPHLNLQMHCGGGSFKSQMKKADKSGATIALIIGDDEVANQTISIKYLRIDREQEIIGQDQLIDYLVESM